MQSGQWPGKLIRPTAPLPLVTVGTRSPLKCVRCQPEFQQKDDDPVWVKCWQCGLVFHFHRQDVLRIPVGANVKGLCPDPQCYAEGVWMRTPPADGYLDTPTDRQESQESALWGKV